MYVPEFVRGCKFAHVCFPWVYVIVGRVLVDRDSFGLCVMKEQTTCMPCCDKDIGPGQKPT